MNETPQPRASNKNHICKQCGTAFSRPYRLKQHEKIHLNIKEFVCGEPNCNKSYTNKSHLDRHIQSVHIERQLNVLYSCKECTKVFVNRQNLKRHLKVTHTRKSWFDCDVCSLSFKKKHTLSAHMYNHTFIKSFSCELCDREFITLTDKRKHMKYHKSYSCELCDMAFIQWSKYIKHKKEIHTSTKEFVCDDCGRKFNKRVHMVRHTKSHNTSYIPAYHCTYENCERVYTTVHNLKQHIKIKHIKIRYDCEICGAKLCTKARLAYHLGLHQTPKIKEVTNVPKKIRKERFDKGIQKVSTALRIAGLMLNPKDVNVGGTLVEPSPEEHVENGIDGDDIKLIECINPPAENVPNVVVNKTVLFVDMF